MPSSCALGGHSDIFDDVMIVCMPSMQMRGIHSDVIIGGTGQVIKYECASMTSSLSVSLIY